MGAEMSTSQTQIIEVLRTVPAEGEVQEQSRLEKLVPLLPGEDLSGPFGTIALMAACDVGDAECAQVLIMAGCDPNAASEEAGAGDAGETGATPLIAAAARGNVGCIRACLQAGADPTVKTSADRTALDVALVSGVPEAIRVVREAPHTRAAGIARRTSAYTKAHLGLERLNRQAIAVHVIDYTDAYGDTRFIIESEDNYRGERKCYHVTRSLSDFRRLHEEMVHDYASLPKAALQNTAPKSVNKHSDEAKRERMRKLEDYLRLVLAHVEQSVGGKYQVFRKDPKRPQRSPAELPFELVIFLGLEDTGFPEGCRATLRQLRQGAGGGDGAVEATAGTPAGGAAAGGRLEGRSTTPPDGVDKAGCPVQ